MKKFHDVMCQGDLFDCESIYSFFSRHVFDRFNNLGCNATLQCYYHINKVYGFTFEEQFGMLAMAQFPDRSEYITRLIFEGMGVKSVDWKKRLYDIHIRRERLVAHIDYQLLGETREQILGEAPPFNDKKGKWCGRCKSNTHWLTHCRKFRRRRGPKRRPGKRASLQA